jgi:glucose-6-phosphate 1-dehydrogenase
MSLFSTDLRQNLPFIMVIFGVSGDLTRRKLVPALFELYQAGFLPNEFTVVGFARRDWSREEMIHQVGNVLGEKNINASEKDLNTFFSHFEYFKGDFEIKVDYERLSVILDELDDKVGQCGRRLFYLATPAESYSVILNGLKDAALQNPCGDNQSWTRVIIEKPFGHDLASAKSLDSEMLNIFEESQIYRIDHYLAKETAQNIMMFRFANSIFEPIWNSNYIEKIEIIVNEEIGIGTRGNFYDKTGALRDIVQNHLLQLLALTTMEQPAAASAKAFRDSRAQLLKSVGCFDLRHLGRNLVLGQYESYKQESNVGPDSRTETFAAVRAEVDLPRWQGVPVFLISGKKLASSMTRVRVAFKNPPKNLFETLAEYKNHNILNFDIQPTEGIGLQLLAKQPGYRNTIQPVTMHFNYHENFREHTIDAYTRLLLDAIDGDQTLFTRSDEIEAEWQFVDPILDRIKDLKIKPEIYKDGGEGPSGLAGLMNQP